MFYVYSIISIIAGFFALIFTIILGQAKGAAILVVLLFALPMWALAIFFGRKAQRKWREKHPPMTYEEQKLRADAKQAERAELQRKKEEARQEAARLKAQQEEERQLQKTVEEMAKNIWCSSNQLEDFLRNGTLPTEYLETPVLLASGETVRYYGAAIYTIIKNKAIGRTGGGAGASFRIAKGVTIHSGRSASQTIYGDVTEEYPGEIVLTDQRLIFLHPQKGFEMKLSSIVAVSAAGGPQIVVQAKSKAYTFYLGSPEIFMQLIRK